MTAITDYASLQTAVADFLHRDDLTSQIQDFIAIAETHLDADISAREMDTRIPISFTANNAYTAVPVGMLDIRRLSIQTDPIRVLKYASPDEITADYPYSTTGTPMVFAIIGEEIQVAPIPDTAYTGEVVYRKSIPRLATNLTNWLITKYPHVYLYGTLLMAEFYVEDQDKFAMIVAAYQKAVDGINSIEWYSGSTLRVRAS